MSVVLNSPLFQRFSLDLLSTLGHSLWQGLVSALMVAFVLNGLPARLNRTRYAIAVGGMLALIVAIFSTWTLLRLSPATNVQPHAAATLAAGHDEPSSSFHASGTALERAASPPAQRQSFTLRSLETFLLLVWMVGSGWMLFRAARGYLTVQRWVGDARLSDCADVARFRRELDHLRRLMRQTRPVRLYLSDNIPSPAVIGNWWPVILVPMSILSEGNVTPAQIRIVLAHELAHIRRWDGLVNLGQLIVESFLFFNPAVWMISRWIRIEREACCDGIAARVNDTPASTVALTLINMAERFSFRPPTPALAINGGDTLRDRVMRLVSPESPPRIGMTWAGALSTLLLVAGSLVLLQQGTTIAVQTAAAMIRPADIDEMARRQATQVSVFAPPANESGPSDNEADSNDSGTVGVRVRVTTADGSPIAGRINISYSHRTPGQGTLGNLTNDTGPIDELRGQERFKPGRFRLAVSAEGYAPVFSDEVSLVPGDGERKFELQLTRGFETSLRMVDENGMKVDGLEVDVVPWLKTEAGGSSLSYQTEKRTVVDGVVALERLSSDAVYQFKLRSPGWEFAETELKLREGKSPTWTVYRAQPTPMEVVDAETGTPISGARIHLAGWNDADASDLPRFGGGDPRNARRSPELTLATTGADGKTTLTSLSRQRQSCLAILAPGYQMKVLRPVVPGQDLGMVKLQRELTVSGELVGDLSKLQTRRRNGQKKTIVQYRNPPPDMGYSDLFDADVDAKGRFEIRGLLPGKFTLQLSGYQKNIELTESIADLRVPIESPMEEETASTQSTREVQVRFGSLPKGLHARGKWAFRWRTESSSGSGEQPIQQNVSKMSLPIGSWVSLESNGLVGVAIGKPEPFRVTPGNGPQVVEIFAVPAGSVDGTVKRADGELASSASVSIFAVSPAPVAEQIEMNQSVSFHGSRFFRSLPLGGTYVAVATERRDSGFAWRVGEPFSLSAEDPIHNLELTFPVGERIPVKVTDSLGRPMPNAPIELQIRFRGHGMQRSQSMVMKTNDSGLANFKNIVTRQEGSPVEVDFVVTAPPHQQHIGEQKELKLDDLPLSLHRKRGFSASGRVIDSETGRPIPTATVVLWPKDASLTRYQRQHTAVTDERGRYEFRGLELIAYYSSVRDTVVPGSKVTRRPGGGYRIESPEFYQPQMVIPDDETAFDLTVSILPGKGLAPIESE